MGGRILSLGGIWTWNIIDYLQLEFTVQYNQNIIPAPICLLSAYQTKYPHRHTTASTLTKIIMPRCTHKGCGKEFDLASNTEEICVHHTGAPVSRPHYPIFTYPP